MRSFASLKEGNVKASKNEPTKGERTKGKRPEGLNGTREGREGERIQVFSPIMACIFSPGPSASTFNISPPCENIGSFFLPRTNSIKGGKRSFPRSPSFHLFHCSSPWKVIAEQVVWKDVDRRRSQTLASGGERATDISDTERGVRSTLTFIRTPSAIQG